MLVELRVPGYLIDAVKNEFDKRIKALEIKNAGMREVAIGTFQEYGREFQKKWPRDRKVLDDDTLPFCKVAVDLPDSVIKRVSRVIKSLDADDIGKYLSYVMIKALLVKHRLVAIYMNPEMTWQGGKLDGQPMFKECYFAVTFQMKQIDRKP